MRHAVAEQPVVGTDVLRAQRVRAVARVAAVQVAPDATGGVEVEDGRLLGDRREGSFQERGRAGPAAGRARGTRPYRGRAGAGPDAEAGHPAPLPRPRRP
ncbi:hypothetical protein GCM10010238_04770 [Streptomyces griseoviridis]|uniref:Uncharacterized protein n=1 Tax=Streptomyces griseoviridis TaxID=45398 RepID=A0A918G693_STRGD|nr:hypothetical protein GCM10010238_04770 [Streptomyces niveoruber]